ncbi:arginine deiminase type-3 [Metarhizium rileyi]|uniref:Arginine deiminase type-3 n=1 Tax=Metarhizium rileyi (strain RCEF 4871) TaxID=1649241 RepID=A0A167HZP9_METRR|nr:arginine deiminase type-3 [Metarhizium rileyi RCEF 4871]
MRPLLQAIALSLVFLTTTGHGLRATILADTNRDGRVDMTGDSDVEGKDTWTEERGALFLANIADTNQRCSSAITDKTNSTSLDECHDASDNVLRNPKGRIIVSGGYARELVRIFHMNGSNWDYVDANHTFRAAELRAGFKMGIDARDIRRPQGWNGAAIINFIVTDDGESASDQVALRVAPVLTRHALQGIDKVFTGAAARWSQEELLISGLEDCSSRAAGLGKSVVRLNNSDHWMQDLFTAGYDKHAWTQRAHQSTHLYQKLTK